MVAPDRPASISQTTWVDAPVRRRETARRKVQSDVELMTGSANPPRNKGRQRSACDGVSPGSGGAEGIGERIGGSGVLAGEVPWYRGATRCCNEKRLPHDRPRSSDSARRWQRFDRTFVIHIGSASIRRAERSGRGDGGGPITARRARRDSRRWGGSAKARRQMQGFPWPTSAILARALQLRPVVTTCRLDRTARSSQRSRARIAVDKGQAARQFGTGRR